MNDEPWQPMDDPVDLKHLSKLVEELGETVAAIGRCMAQGIDACHPVTGKSNKAWLEEEMADVAAGFYLAERRFKLDVPAMLRRTHMKIGLLQKWHDGASAFRKP